MYLAIEVFCLLGSENGHNLSFASFVVDVETVGGERVINDCYIMFNSVEQVVVTIGIDKEN